MGKCFAICPFCGCGCGMYLVSTDEHLFAALPSQAHPLGAGRLCVRGWQAGGLIHSTRRLLRPHLRQREVSWESAIQAAAEGISSVLQHGPQAIGVLGAGHLTNEQAFACRWYATEVLRTPNLDNSARALDAGSIWGLEQTFCVPYRSPVLAEIARGDLILCLSSNLCWDNPQAAGYIMQAANAGAAVIVADEVDQGLRELAALYVQHRPGARGALLHLIVESLASLGELHADERLLLGQIGVTPETLREVCSYLRAAKRLAIVFSTAALPVPEDVAHLDEMVMLLKASGAEAAEIFALRSDCNGVGVTDMDLIPPRASEGRGLGAFEMLADDSQLRGMLVFDEALEKFVGEQALHRLRERLDFLLYVGCFGTATSQLADVALPMAGWGESEGTFTCHDGSVWPVHSIASPAGESRELPQILRDLSAAQGGPALEADLAALQARISQQVLGYGRIDWRQVAAGHPAQTVPALGEDAYGTGIVGSEVPALAGAGPQRPYALVVRRDTGSWAFDARITGVDLLDRELEHHHAPFILLNPETCRSLKVRAGRPIRVSTVFGSEALPVRLGAGVPPEVALLPWQFRDAAHALAGPLHFEPRSRSAYHLPVAASLETPTEA